MTGRPLLAGSVVFTALTIAPCIPSAASYVKSTVTFSKPAASRPASYSDLERAPAMQPTKLPRSARSSGVQMILGDDVADADPSAGLQHTADLGEDGWLVG